MHHFHPFFQNIFSETPIPPPFCERIKTPLLGFISSSIAKVKILLEIGALKAKLTHNLKGEINKKNFFSLSLRRFAPIWLHPPLNPLDLPLIAIVNQSISLKKFPETNCLVDYLSFAK